MGGILKVKDPATGEWLDIIPGGRLGPMGTTGPMGETGPTGPPALPNEVHLGTSQPDLTLMPAATLWYDTDGQAAYGVLALPSGGVDGDALVKATGADQDWGWASHLPLAGGTISGNLTVTPNVRVNGTLTAPTVAGNVNFEAGISAEAIEDRTAYAWEYWDAPANFAGGWESLGADGGNHGPCVVARDKYTVVVSLCFRRTGIRNDDSWEYLFNGGLPVGWRPQRELFDTRQSVEDWEVGTIFETKLNSAGQVYIRAKRYSVTWNEWSIIPVHFSYPRYG